MHIQKQPQKLSDQQLRLLLMEIPRGCIGKVRVYVSLEPLLVASQTKISVHLNDRLFYCGKETITLFLPSCFALYSAISARLSVWLSISSMRLCATPTDIVTFTGSPEVT